jgi:hypothetical protein
MMNQRYFSREEIDEHLRAGTWESLRLDDRVCWSEWRDSTNMSVRSYLRTSGRKTEAHHLWDAQRAQR